MTITEMRAHEARRLIQNHKRDFDDFTVEVAQVDHQTWYDVTDVLVWLGYDVRMRQTSENVDAG